MRILYKSDEKLLNSDQQGLKTISRIVQLVNKKSEAKLVFDMKRIKRVGGNLSSVYAALGYHMDKSKNTLRILPRKACGVNVSLKRDMFGYFTDWCHELEKTFKTGSTRVFAFDPHDIYAFNDYLLHDAFRKDWKRVIPYHYKLDVKEHLRELFRNASEHSNVSSPIFVGSSYDGEVLRFTLIDCGVGFMEVVGRSSDAAISENEAIKLALDGYSVKARGYGISSLKRLGDYCVENDGELLVTSGSASVRFDKKGTHNTALLPGAFRGSIISLSVRIILPEFLAVAA